MKGDGPVLRVAGIQTENRIGDFEGNLDEIAEAIDWAEAEGADVVVFPELALTGYPLDDLVSHAGFVTDADETLRLLAARTRMTTAVVSTIRRVPPRRTKDTRYRSLAITAAVLHDGEVRGFYDKTLLPTYSVFDEQRVFTVGDDPDRIWRLGETIVGIAICEDAWSGDGPPEAQAAAGAQIMLLPNASPFEVHKDVRRLDLARRVARRTGCPLVYVNCHGGADGLVFDGGSLVVDAEGALLHRSPQFRGDRFLLDVACSPPRRLLRAPVTVHTRTTTQWSAAATAFPAGQSAAQGSAPMDDRAQIWEAVVVGTRDFARHNGFSEATIGLSGGLDSALTAAVAVDALGADRVVAVIAPSDTTDPGDLADAREVAGLLGVRLVEVDVSGVAAALAAAVGSGLEGAPEHAGTRLVLRVRAALLWAVADAGKRLLLAALNKSELSVGATVPGGDLIGHLAPLADCPKTLLAELATFRNSRGRVVPSRLLDKETTVERSSGIPDLDWATVDGVVERYVEQMQGLEQLTLHTADRHTVELLTRRVVDAELDRRLAPIGIRISGRAYGSDRRVPVSQVWRPHLAPSGLEALSLEDEAAPGEEGARDPETLLPVNPSG